MARELHTLNETEMGMVNEYVEMGIASTHEEALKFLIESGMINDTVGTKGVYCPEGFKHLKFHNGHQKSKYTQVDKLSKKAKKDSPFELENWYFGSEFPKGEDGNIILDEVVKGDELGLNPELIITHIIYSGRRFNPNKPTEAIETTLSNGMNNEQQKQMIDLKSKKSLYDIRQEQTKSYGVEKYSDIPDKDEKIKFSIHVFGLVKTEDGWKKAWLVDTVGKPEFRLESDFLEEIKAKKKLIFNFIVTLQTEEDSGNAGSYIRKLIIKEERDNTDASLIPLIGECNRAISKFLADQKDSVSKTSSNSSGQAPQVDTLEDEEIDWDK